MVINSFGTTLLLAVEDEISLATLFEKMFDVKGIHLMFRR